MIRRCDGTDPNLTRQVPKAEFDAASPPMTVSRNWSFRAEPGHVVICCQCGKVFDDVDHLVTYPHEALPPKMTGEQLSELMASLDGGP